MQPGELSNHLPYRKTRINPAFRDAVRLVMRDRIPGHALALMVGFSQQSPLSRLVHQQFTATPVTMEKLHRLAKPMRRCWSWCGNRPSAQS